MRVELLADDEVFRRKTKPTATQLAGLAYEKRVSNWLAASCRFYPQLAFRIAGKVIIPDGLLTDGKDWAVVEIKTQGNAAAYAQVGFYQKVLSFWFGKQVAALLICSEHIPQSKPWYAVVIPDIGYTFWNEFSVFPLGNRSLTVGAGDGLRVGESTVNTPVRASRSAGDVTDSLRRVSILEPLP